MKRAATTAPRAPHVQFLRRHNTISGMGARIPRKDPNKGTKTDAKKKRAERNPPATIQPMVLPLGYRPGVFIALPDGCRKGKQGDVPCALDGECDLSLVSRAVSGDSPWDDLSPFRDEMAKKLGILIINLQV